MSEEYSIEFTKEDELLDRIAELEGQVTRAFEVLEDKRKKIAELEKAYKENAELKKEWQEQVQKATDEGYARTLQTIQLNKAKALLKQFLEAKNSEDTYKAEFEAEQFLKESEVEK